VALALLLSLGLFCWLVVVPVWRVRAVVQDRMIGRLDEKGAIERLGGPDKAARQLTIYLRMPGEWRNDVPPEGELVLSAPPKAVAWSLLVGCKGAAVDYLLGELRDDSRDVRCLAASALGRIGADARTAVPALEKALNDEDERVRQAAAEALKKIQEAAGARLPGKRRVRLYSDAEVEAFRGRLAKLTFPVSHEELWAPLGVDGARLPIPLGGTGGQSWSGQTQLSQSCWIRYWGHSDKITGAEIYRKTQER